MRHITDSLMAQNGTRLFMQAWLPEGEPKAVVMLVHGLAEHSGRYGHVAAFLVERGFAFYAMDLRGHGQSEGLRAYADGLDVFLDDLYGCFQAMRAAHSGRKCFIMGHSMGGTLALIFAARHQSELAGVVTSGATVSLGAAVPPVLKAVGGVLSAVAPRLPLMAIPAQTVSKDPAVKAAYDADPLNYRGKIRARMGALLLAMGEEALRSAAQITIPALIMHGGADTLSDPGGLDEIYGLLASADKTRRLYEGLYHEIFNEPEKEQVLADVAAWLEARL